jgi:hypothetical protein
MYPLLEGLLVIGLGILLVTQFLMPIYLGRPIFPMFRKEQKLDKELAAARERVAEARLGHVIENVSKEAQRIEEGPPNLAVMPEKEQPKTEAEVRARGSEESAENLGGFNAKNNI